MEVCRSLFVDEDKIKEFKRHSEYIIASEFFDPEDPFKGSSRLLRLLERPSRTVVIFEYREEPEYIEFIFDVADKVPLRTRFILDRRLRNRLDVHVISRLVPICYC